jgi:hypothetical protein
MSYLPNWSDPRVIARCQRAMGFVCGVMSSTKSHSWSSRYIDKYLGKSNNPLSKYLRENLLIVTDDFYRYNSTENKCKEYRLNKDGLESLRDNLKTNNTLIYPSVLQVAKEDHLEELATGKFEYSDKSQRLWHPLQRYRKQYKQQILTEHGYQHQYDIECCAPTLIHQYSQMITEVIDANGRWQQGSMDLYLFALRIYLNEKNEIRQELANELDLPIEAAKEIINALFAGAVISQNKDSDIYQILNGDRARIEYLKQNVFIQQLKEDIKTCWEYIRPVMQKRTKTQLNGKERLCPLTSKQKWQVYFEQERRVLDVVRSYLDERDIRYFLEHDGWSCNKELDQIELRKYIRDKIGFDIKFDYMKTNNTLIYPSVLQVQKELICP